MRSHMFYQLVWKHYHILQEHEAFHLCGSTCVFWDDKLVWMQYRIVHKREAFHQYISSCACLNDNYMRINYHILNICKAFPLFQCFRLTLAHAHFANAIMNARGQSPKWSRILRVQNLAVYSLFYRKIRRYEISLTSVWHRIYHKRISSETKISSLTHRWQVFCFKLLRKHTAYKYKWIDVSVMLEFFSKPPFCVFIHCFA